jgi:DNA polymerase I-like protein with 3'-5' exonuclease and polymerase domains
MKSFPALKKLIDAVKEVAKTRKWLRGLDGRKVPCRSPHSALNTLLQGAGALAMKKALCILDDSLQYLGLIPGQHYEFVLNIHDEFQLERLDPQVDKQFLGELAKDAITAAGDYFYFRCRLDGEYKLGSNWAETH